MDTLDLTNAAASPVRGRHVDNLQALMVPLLAFVGRGDLVDPLLNPYGVPDGIAGAGTAEALAVTQDVLRFFGLYSGKTDRVCGPGTWRGLIEF